MEAIGAEKLATYVTDLQEKLKIGVCGISNGFII
jgi:hypothetical protein